MATVNPILFRGFENWTDAARLASDHDIDLSKGPPLGVRAHAAVAFGLVALVVYASLFPFHFESHSLSDAGARIEAGFRHQPIDLGDFLANILLFVALGYFLLGTLRVDRAGSSLLSTTAAFGIASGLSLGVEMLQAFFPPRTPCLNDILGQVLGACIGFAIWECSGHRLTARFRRAWTSGDLREHTGLLLTGYVCILVTATMLPFDFDVRTEVLTRKLGSAFARLLDMDVAPAGTSAYLWDLVFFAPAGLLAAFVTRRNGRRGEAMRAMRLGLAIVLTVAAATLAVRGKRVDAFAGVVDLAAFGLGWLQGRMMRRCWHRGAAPTTPAQVIIAVSLVAAWCTAATTLLHGEPLNFTDNPTFLLDRMKAMNWLPLNDIYYDKYLLVLRKALQQSMLFLVGGATLALAVRNVFGHGRAALIAVVVLIAAFLLEVGQLSRSGVAPSITAVIWQAAAAWLGSVLVRGLLPTRLGTARTLALLPATIHMQTNRSSQYQESEHSSTPCEAPECPCGPQFASAAN